MRRFRLAPLTAEETAEFIRVRLRQKQGGVTLVPESVFGEIHRRTGGVPRMITALCGAAIERCEESQTKAVDIELLEQVASEFGV
jgi:general secretion pathway protein A